LLFNPLRFINPANAEKKVRNLKLENPNFSDDELCELIIRERSLLCAISGILTTLPAVFPVIGTLVTLVGGIALDISLISYFMMRMVMELGIIHGRKTGYQGMSGETVLVLAAAVGSDTLNKTVSKVAVAQMGNQAAVNVVQKILISLGIKSTPRLAVRIIPLAGAGIAGGINYFLCKKVGQRVKNYYRSQIDGDRFKETIDIDFSWEKGK
jgi:hypothetical protein